MKNYLTIYLIALSSCALAQTIPLDVNIPPAPPSNTVEANHRITISPSFNTNGGTYQFRVIPNRYATDPSASVNNYNFIKVEESFFNYNTTQLAAANPDQKNVTWQYFDGLGRAMQTVQGKSSPDFRDIIIPVAYDQYGRQIREYLPYTKANDGRFQTTALTDQSTFYNPVNPYNQKIKTDGAPYAETVFESSPLNRVLQNGAPGTLWQPNTTTPSDGKAIKSEYLVNVDGTSAGQEKIKNWTLSSVTLNGKTEYLLSSPGFYASNTLFISVVKDEDNREVRTYTDKQGKTILKKVQYVSGTPAANNDNDWILTYYIYDEYERLRFVLQPKFVARNSVYDGLSTDQLKKDMLDSLTFEYRYDERGRMIYKRVPGAKQVDMVYDQWDRLALSRDGNQNGSGRWSFTKYDLHNRPVITGEFSSSNTRDQMVTAVNAITNRFESTTSGNGVGYTLNQTYPTTASISDIFTITYYDDYSFKTNLSLGTAYDASIPSGFTGVVNNRIKGLVTGTKVRVMESSPLKWLVSVNYYDDRYRVLQNIGDDHLDNKNRATNEYYGITPWVTKTQLSHGSSLTMLIETEFDHRGRVKNTWQTMDAGTRVLLAANRYNDLGELVEKNVHSTDNGATFLQSNDYRYNIRGWLTHINNSALNNDGTVNDDANDLFGMELKYTDPVSVNGTNTTAQYNGSISAIQWKSTNLKDAADEKIYGFSYDNLNRLTNARYATKNGGSWNGSSNLFNEGSISYDKNGNINALSRNASIDGANAVIDQLAYKYQGNRLINVHDNSSYYDGNNPNPDFGFKEITHNTGLTEYTYDANGSMKYDLNKDITEILYNHLNLPRLVTLSGNRSVEYIYDATGVKLRKIAGTNGSIISQTDYVGGIQYEGATPVLKFVSTGEGRVVKNASNWDYEYFHKDHLGNTRVVYGYMKQVDEYKATMETALASQEDSPAMFKNVNATRVTAFNHTLASGQVTEPDKSAETNGNISGKAVGPAKMLQVSSGDRVQLEVFARYATGTAGNNTIITTLAAAVTGAFALGSGETPYTALTNNVPGQAATISQTTNVPKAYLFYILFDNNYVYQGQFGYQTISSAALVGHERLYLDFTIPTSGFLYTYVVNESNVSTSTSVYFDDFNIIHTRAASALQVVQVTDYYPFGLTVNPLSYQKQSSLDNDYQYNGKELQDEHNLGWLDYATRMYSPELSRFFNIDMLAEKYNTWTPYIYAANNPIRFIDYNGNGPGDGITGKQILKTFDDGKKATGYQLTLYVNQPGKGGDRDTYEPKNAKALFGRDAGHTFTALRKFNEDGSVTEKIFGWYPGTKEDHGAVNIMTGDAEDRAGNKTGSFRDDNGDEYEVSITFDISEEGFLNVLGDVLRTDEKVFNLNNNNCSNIGIQLVRASGNELNGTTGTWEFVGFSVGAGINPGDLGEDLRQNPKANQKPGVAKTKDYDEKEKNKSSSSSY